MVDISLTPLIYFVGTFFVIIFASKIFNDPVYSPKDKYIQDALGKYPRMFPALPKYLAEKTRYRIYLWTFVFLTVVFYYFISLAFPYFMSGILGKEGVVKDFSLALVVCTVAFIAGSTKIPFAKTLLDEWKERLHRRAKIPDTAMYVFDSMRYSEINKSSEQFRKNLEAILNGKVSGEVRGDIEKDYFYFDKSRIERKWARLVYLMHAIEQWSKKSQFERHLKVESLKWLALRSYYIDKLIPEMKRYRQGELKDDAIEAAKENIDRMAIKIYWLITLLLFMANKAEEDPCIHLKRIGWIVAPDKYFKFSNGQVIFTGTMTFLSIVAGATIGALLLLNIADNEAAKLYEIRSDTIFYWFLFGIPMFTMPLIVTMFAKRILSMDGTWSVQRPEETITPFFRRKWDIYFIVSTLSYVITLAVLLVIYFLIGFSRGSIDISRIDDLALYSGLAFVSAMFISYLIDTPDPGWETSWRYYLKSIAPAIFQGVVNVSLVTFAFLLLSDGGKLNPFSLKPAEMGRLMVYDVIVFIIGITMYFTSRIGTKFYERRENGIVRSTEGWWTIAVDSITKRVETVKLPGNSMEIMADDELKHISDVGDTVEFYDRNKLAMTGEIEEIYDDLIRVSLPA